MASVAERKRMSFIISPFIVVYVAIKIVVTQWLLCSCVYQNCYETFAIIVYSELSEVPVVFGKLYIILRLDSQQVYVRGRGCIFFVLVEFTKNKICLRD